MEEWIKGLAEHDLLGNSLLAWVTALGIFVGVILFLKAVQALVRRYMRGLAQKTSTKLDDLAVTLVDVTRPFALVAIGAFVALRYLKLPEAVDKAVAATAIILLLVQAGLWVSRSITFLIDSFVEDRSDDDPAAVSGVNAIGVVARILSWSLILLLCLANLGVDITALVAGLGVGGIAVALAVQNVLSDLLASLSIILDKPFVRGDFIIVGDLMGTVEHIGLKTTRLRSLSGEQLVFANGDLLKSRIRNLKRMDERRVAFNIGVTYDTPADKLERIPDMIREIVGAEEQARFDRAFFMTWGDFALIYDIVYYVSVPDYQVYAALQQTINLGIFRRFEKEGIEFAYPTQTVYMHKADVG
jgi:small-conductance mechanosensitive channel